MSFIDKKFGFTYIEVFETKKTLTNLMEISKKIVQKEIIEAQANFLTFRTDGLSILLRSLRT